MSANTSDINVVAIRVAPLLDSHNETDRIQIGMFYCDRAATCGLTSGAHSTGEMLI